MPNFSMSGNHDERHPGIHRRFENHDGVGAFWYRFEDRFTCGLNIREVRFEIG